MTRFLISSAVSTLYLVPAEVVDHHHANEVHQHAEALEGGNGQSQGAILLGQAGAVVPAEGASLLTGQALPRHL